MIRHDAVDIFLVRQWFTRMSTIGELFFPEEPILSSVLEKDLQSVIDKLKRECFILEDEARPKNVKIKEQTCIADDDYFLKITMSNRFKRLMPLIFNEDVFTHPNGEKEYDLVHFDNVIFTGVRMHTGNTIENTEACQLTGTERGNDKVIHSVDAFDPFYKKLHSKIGTSKKLRYRIINLQR